MQSFGYCIWLIPEKSSWEFLGKGFQTHITLYKNLNFSNALSIFLSIKNSVPMDIIRSNETCFSETNGFNAEHFNVNFKKNIKPIWWPRDAHVSIRYNYNKPFVKKTDIKDVPLNCKFNKIIIMNCSDHYTKWYKVL